MPRTEVEPKRKTFYQVYMENKERQEREKLPPKEQARFDRMMSASDKRLRPLLRESKRKRALSCLEASKIHVGPC